MAKAEAKPVTASGDILAPAPEPSSNVPLSGAALLIALGGVLREDPPQRLPAIWTDKDERVRCMLKAGSFTPTERLILLAVAALDRARGTLLQIRLIAGTQRTYTASVIQTLVKRGICFSSIVRFPPTGAGIQTYGIAFKSEREAPKVCAGLDFHWTLATGASYDEGFAEMRDPMED